MKFASIAIVVFLIFSGVNIFIPKATDTNIQTKTLTLNLSETEIINQNSNIIIQIPESTTYTTQPGKPRLPTIEKTLSFPINTKITKISCIPIIDNTTIPAVVMN